ncbi:DNA polymerase I [Chlorobium phaeobacteroides]|uniref:DNA polymerase I n=1 Tax=Chlorobium phaeobacteroides (strain DSM 266 / SMG 266 / 2430) TaxID=290317 RepID=A1BDW6_CHLPD|nr:DNA polymerase I [Chlorobium phaeobacteroides]ABL64593.1 DNA polymerase I [Chlorobium phaeobacteroides DSM 266]
MSIDNQFDFFQAGCGQPSEATKKNIPEKKPALFLIDGMAMVYRAYYALQSARMKTRDGLPSGAVFGFTSALLKIFETYKPDYLAVAFDSREKTFRHDLYDLYKANRPSPPEDLISQLDAIYQLVTLLGIPIIKTAGFEADDLIGSLARKFEKSCAIYIVTPDKDLAQLVNDEVYILKPGKIQNELELLGIKEITIQFGVRPEQFTDFLALAGDASDNIPGAKGIGPKTAASLIGKYGSIASILLNLNEISPKNRQSLEEFQPRLKLIRQLVTIRTDLDLHVSLQNLATTTPDVEKILPFLKQYELKSIAARLPAIFPEMNLQPESLPADNENNEKNDSPELTAPGSAKDGADYRIVTRKEELQALVEQLNHAAALAVDTETTSLDTFQAELVGISLSIKPKQAWFVYFGKGGVDRRVALDMLKPVLENPSLRKTGQNLKYDLLVLKKYGIDINPVAFDTMLASYVLDPEAKHNLDDLALRHLSIKTTTYDELVADGKKKMSILDVPPGELSDYACQDADLALRLQEVFKEKLLQEKDLLWLCENIEFPLVPVLATMEYHGISIDTDHLKKTETTVSKQIGQLSEKIFEASGRVFNLDSPKQLAHILFDILGLPSGKATKTGFSTNVQVLEDLAPIHPVAQDLLEYRSLQKLRNTYIEALPKMINPLTGKLHTSFNQHVTATGRLSSSHPNLQNIPIRTLIGKEIRRAFIPSNPENLLLSADYSQIELRVAAEISGDEKLMEAFRNREDIHSATARTIFNTTEITPEMRRKAKEVNFGVLYGIMPFGLSRRLNISRNEAKNIIDTYTEKYPGIFNALQQIISDGKERGYVSTLLGRRRYIPDLNSRNKNMQKAAERAAMNTPIQGTAADIIKCAMNLCSTQLRLHKMKSVMLLQVHDELLFETPENEKHRLKTLVEEVMIDAAKRCGLHNVPVEVDTGIGKNWLEAH